MLWTLSFDNRPNYLLCSLYKLCYCPHAISVQIVLIIALHNPKYALKCLQQLQFDLLPEAAAAAAAAALPKLPAVAA